MNLRGGRLAFVNSSASIWHGTQPRVSAGRSQGRAALNKSRENVLVCIGHCHFHPKSFYLSSKSARPTRPGAVKGRGSTLILPGHWQLSTYLLGSAGRREVLHRCYSAGRGSAQSEGLRVQGPSAAAGGGKRARAGTSLGVPLRGYLPTMNPSLLGGKGDPLPHLASCGINVSPCTGPLSRALAHCGHLVNVGCSSLLSTVRLTGWRG